MRNEKTKGLAAKKLDIISWITSLKDENVLNRIELLRKGEDDWWDTIDEDEKAEILRDYRNWIEVNQLLMNR